MRKPLLISLNRGDRIYVNGAVIRVDRRVGFEFLNDVRFLLQQHVLKAEEATTPLRQLYFLVQAIVLDAKPDGPAHAMSRTVLAELAGTVTDIDLLAGLAEVAGLFERERYFEVLRALRTLVSVEQAVLDRGTSTRSRQEEIEHAG